MLANPAVVAHVHHVVQLRPLADRSHPQRGAVDARIRADLHKVPDLNPAHLGRFVRSGVFHHVAEAVGSNHTPRVQHASAPNVHIVINRNIGMQYAALPSDTRLPTMQPAWIAVATPIRVSSPTTAWGPT